MNLEELELDELLDTDDVGQKRYLMYQVFDRLLEKVYDENDTELPELQERISRLRGSNGYFYKLAQEFLTSSSTLEKERKLEKMLEHMR